MQTSPIIEKLAKLPRGQRFLVYLVVWLLTGAIFFFGLYMPAQNEVASLKTNRVNLERQKAQVAAYIQTKILKTQYLSNTQQSKMLKIQLLK